MQLNKWKTVKRFIIIIPKNTKNQVFLHNDKMSSPKYANDLRYPTDMNV